LLNSMRRFFQHDEEEDKFDWREKNGELLALINARKVDEALIVGQELLDYVDRKYKKDSREKATTYNNMGMVFLLSREYSLAEQCFHNALDMRKRIFGENHNEVAIILMNLAQLYKVQAQEILAVNRVET
jgi:tetratricopeptide (TPR) repeat protein